jgi:4,5-DOPA dioxygenase extradiol
MKSPAIFVSHGSPMIAIEDDAYTAALEAAGRRLPKPKAIVIVSAHWEASAPVRVNASAKPGVFYDFGGFPASLYRLTYDSPGDPALAAEIVLMLNASSVKAELETKRALDHGVWVPLRRLFPEADIPVIEVSLPVPRSAQLVLKMGEALSPLRERGVLLMGSGGIVHNLRMIHPGDDHVDDWAGQFDSWVDSKINARDVDSLLAYADRAPHANLAVPASEHFDPLFFALGASKGDRPSTLFAGFQYGNLSLRSVTFGA